MSNIKTITAITRSIDPAIAAQELRQQLSNPHITFVLFYCSSVYSLQRLASNMASAFEGFDLVGCTTAGEITPNGYEQHSIIAIGFSASYFAISTQIVESMENFTLIDAQETINKLTENCYVKKLAAIKNNSFLLTLLDGLSADEEQFLVTLNSASGGIPHFGGSAGDDIHLATTHVFYQGSFYQNAAIVLMVNTPCAFEVFSCNHIKYPTSKVVVTAADADSRTVFELNAEPAALEYARLLNVAVGELSPELFALHPLAVKVGGQYYIRSIQKVNEADFSLTFYCAVDVGIVLSTVVMDDIFASLSSELSRMTYQYGEPELVLTCDCFLRRLEIEQRQQLQQAKELQQRYNIRGFNTYGEHIDGTHLNQTFTGVFIAGGNK
ncbi:MAG: GfdT protein [Alteromonadaceae bacterium]|nr:GfdT protein [Alteromonadaceae bacterium]MBB18094.1 GfdT protein [Rickettsiales bacterium]